MGKKNYDAEPVPHGGTFPTDVTPGQVRMVHETMKNTGKQTWESNQYFLHLTRSYWRLDKVKLKEDVPPGGEHRFRFKITAPNDEGDYEFQTRMQTKGGREFGTPTELHIATVKKATTGRGSGK